MYPRPTLSHFTHDVKYENKMIDSEMKKRMSADNIGRRDVSHSNTGRNGRRSKHKFLHDLYLSVIGINRLLRPCSRHSPKTKLRPNLCLHCVLYHFFGILVKWLFLIFFRARNRRRTYSPKLCIPLFPFGKIRRARKLPLDTAIDCQFGGLPLFKPLGIAFGRSNSVS